MATKNRIRLNGTDYTNYATDLQTLAVRFVLNSQDATVAYSLSSDKLAFSGPAAALVRSLLVDPFATIQVQIDLKCCDLTLTYTISSKGVEDCGDDYVKAQLVTSTTETAAYEVLNRTIIVKDPETPFVQWLIGMGKNYRIEYCNEPGYIGFIILFLYILIYPVLAFISIVADLFTDSGIADLDRWELAVVGCGRYYTTFTVNDMLTYYADQAGLGYASSILQNEPYASMIVVDGTHGKGVYVDQIVDWNDRNIFNLTVTQFLEVLVPVFRADFRIINGVLRVEPVEWFADNAAKIADFEFDDVNCMCYALEVDQFKAYGRYQYETDPVDEAGNEAQADYNDIVEWNNPVSDVLKGEKTRSLKFAPCRFVSDKHRDRFITGFRHNNNQGSRRHELVISRDQLSKMKLIIIDRVGSVRKWFKVAKAFFVSGNTYDYNRDMKFDQLATFDELYKRFHFPDNPRYQTIGEIDSIEAKLNICNTINAIYANGMNVYIRTEWGRAIPEEIEVNTGTGVVTFKNCKVWP